MIYIIDANNLAGQLGILSHDNFDKELVEIVANYFFGKDMRILLVFDSNDPMGDKIKRDNLEIIYTPRDNYYNSADDKVLELVSLEIDSGAGNNQITVVTDDIDLKEAIQKEADRRDYKINMVQASDFVLKINRKEEFIQEEDDRGLSENDEDSITKELMREWSK